MLDAAEIPAHTTTSEAIVSRMSAPRDRAETGAGAVGSITGSP
jgi:hypothetical protein